MCPVGRKLIPAFCSYCCFMDKDITAKKLEIAKRIKDLRIQAGYTSYETFANQYNMSRRNYFRLETDFSDVKFSTLFKICTIHGITLEQFFKGI